METTDRIFRHSCARCERPAITFDGDHRLLCVLDASVIVLAQRVVASDDRWWEDLTFEASG